MIKVFVCANSKAELEGLEAVVRSGPSLEFVGSNFGDTDLREEIEDAEPDVLLQRVLTDGLNESGFAAQEQIDLPSVVAGMSHPRLFAG